MSVSCIQPMSHFMPFAGLENSDAIAAARHGREVQRDHERIVVVFAVAHVGEHAVVGVVGVDPAHAVGAEVELVHGRFAAIEGVEVADPALDALM